MSSTSSCWRETQFRKAFWVTVFLVLFPCLIFGNCPPGFSGSHCQVENVALGCEATQTTTADDCQWCSPTNPCPPAVCGLKNASLAVDGDRTTDYWAGSCTHTVPNLTSPSWWEVDLGVNHTLNWLTMYLWDSPSNRVRLTSFTVEIDDTLCYQQTGPVPPEVVTVTCVRAIEGQRVKVTQLTPDAEARYSLTLCEVEVPVCRGAWWGYNCTTPCNCRDVTENCHMVTGACSTSGCRDGWTGTSCDVICPNGTWGYNCSSTCGACRDGAICRQENGACPAGCEIGYSGAQCDRACEAGSYGLDCLGQCGPCLDGQPCNATNGACADGCGPGWQWLNDTCVERCDEYTFGQNCSESCGSCYGGETCNHVTGSCAQGCAWGWIGSVCRDRGLPDYIIVVIAVTVTFGVSLVVGVLICNCRGRRKRIRREKMAGKSDLSMYDVGYVNPYVGHAVAHIGDVNPVFTAQPRASWRELGTDPRRESLRSGGDNWETFEDRGDNRSSTRSISGDRPSVEYALPRLKVMTHF